MVSVVPSGSARRRGRAIAAVLLLLVPSAAGAYYFGYHVGTIRVSVTDDAILDFASLNITFSEVAVHTTTALTPSPWVVLALTNRTVDLTKLDHNLSATVGFDKIQAGKYTQLRIVVANVTGVLKSGERVTVEVPSGELKTETPFELKAQGSASIVVRLLVVETGTRYLLQPALGSVITQ